MYQKKTWASKGHYTVVAEGRPQTFQEGLRVVSHAGSELPGGYHTARECLEHVQFTLFQAVQFSSVVQSLGRFRLFATVDCDTPGLPIHHQLPELAQTDVH